MKCPKCGRTNSKYARFCQYCAQDLSEKSFLSRHKVALVLFLAFIVVFILPLLFFLKLIFSVKLEEEEVVSGYGKEKIALINIDGIIVENRPIGGLGTVTDEFTSSREIKKLLKEASSSEVKALILRINSPGGSAVASEEIYQDLLDFKKKTNKKIVAYFSDVAASGGYYVSMAADAIVANPSTITGSIGVMISYLNFKDLARNVGIKHIVYKTGEFKDLLNSFEEPTKEENKIIQEVLDDSFENFLSAVSAGRKLNMNRVRELADGRIYSAAQAANFSLIDRIGTLEVAISFAKNLAKVKDASVIELGQPRFWDFFLGNLGSNFKLSIPQLALFDQREGIRVLFLYSP